MINVGVIGLGMMGNTHLDIYAKLRCVNVMAVSDRDPKRLSGEEQAGGNIEGQAQGGFDFQNAKRYADGMELIADPDVQMVDICAPTPVHLKLAKAALAAGKHVLVEKPLARTAADADELAALGEAATGLSMPAMCMRFWPGWTWLKRTIDEKTYGKVLAATFRRVSQHPGGPFYENGDACGGALLDLHIHDVDFILHCFGTPKRVYSRGYSKQTNCTDHVVTQYEYDDVPVVTAEGSWAMSAEFGFSMRYCVNFERATAVFDLAADNPLMLYEAGQPAKPVTLEEGMGYEHEIRYFLDCIKAGKKPETVTLGDAALAVRVIEAEAKSIEQASPITLG